MASRTEKATFELNDTDHARDLLLFFEEIIQAIHESGAKISSYQPVDGSLIITLEKEVRL